MNAASTGDVWDMAGYCTCLTTPSLERLQKEIRKRFNLAAQEYKELRAKKPMCDAG